MPSLNDILLKDSSRGRLIGDGVVLIDQEVAEKKGLGGVAIKGGYAFVKTIKRDFVKDALEGLIDDFVAQLDPFFQEHGSTKGFGEFMLNNKARVADGLLGVTDRRRDRTSHAALRKAYDKLRPAAKSNVEQAIPRLASMIQKHLDSHAAG